MALDPKKRQKKLAKRKAQRKEKVKKIVVQQLQQIAYQSNPVAFAAKYPLHQCLSNLSIFASGMGSVVVSRTAPNGDIVLSMFLLDTFCLGVKSVISKLLSPYEYDDLISKIQSNEMIQVVEPSYARKLVEGAVEYAATLGFKPDPDYHKAKEIFGDIDASECTDEFAFGKLGKPFYMSGPMDTPLKRQQIVKTLEKNCGIGNFDFMIHNDPMGMGFNFDDDEDDYDEFDDDEFDDHDDDFEFEDDEGEENDNPKLLS